MVAGDTTGDGACLSDFLNPENFKSFRKMFQGD